MENISYAFVQSLHNLGAVGVVSIPIMVLYLLHHKVVFEIRIYILIAFVSAVLQILSGMGFALTSYIFLGQIPEVEGIAFGALVLKVSSVVISLFLYVYLLLSIKLKSWASRTIWYVLIFLGFTPLIGAAFLRWYG